MKIIQKQPNPSGAYPAILTWYESTPPDTHFEVDCETEDFYSWNGFVIPTIKNGKVTSFVCNNEAWELWKSSQPQPLTPIEQSRVEAVSRIDGKCSAAIYAGFDLNGKHYTATLLDQSTIKDALLAFSMGQTVYPYAAVGEARTPHTKAQIEPIATKMNAWGLVNTGYKTQLKVWINRETNTAVLSGIDYGSTLPTDLMQALGAELEQYGINLADYAALLK